MKLYIYVRVYDAGTLLNRDNVQRFMKGMIDTGYNLIDFNGMTMTFEAPDGVTDVMALNLVRTVATVCGVTIVERDAFIS